MEWFIINSLSSNCLHICFGLQLTRRHRICYRHGFAQYSEWWFQSYWTRWVHVEHTSQTIWQQSFHILSVVFCIVNNGKKKCQCLGRKTDIASWEWRHLRCIQKASTFDPVQLERIEVFPEALGPSDKITAGPCPDLWFRDLLNDLSNFYGGNFNNLLLAGETLIQLCQSNRKKNCSDFSYRTAIAC